MSEHTPIALVEYRGDNFWLDEQIDTASGATIYIHDSTSKGNDLGKFIVRACNSHTDLLEALVFLVDAAITEPSMSIYKAHIEQAQLAIAKARN